MCTHQSCGLNTESDTNVVIMKMAFEQFDATKIVHEGRIFGSTSRGTPQVAVRGHSSVGSPDIKYLSDPASVGLT